MNRFRQILAVLLFVPAMMLAQSSTENYVRAETMLNADGNNAMVSVQNDQKNRPCDCCLNVMRDKTFYPKTTSKYKKFVKNRYNYYKKREVK